MFNRGPSGKANTLSLLCAAAALLASAVATPGCSSSNPSPDPPDAPAEQKADLDAHDATRKLDSFMEMPELQDSGNDEDLPGADLQDAEAPDTPPPDSDLPDADFMEAEVDVDEVEALDELGQACEGLSDGCGGSCGECTGCGQTCVDGACKFTACAEKACGTDGCGGYCGSCLEDFKCDGGVCIPKTMTWIVIPPGDFIMGCSPGDDFCDTDENPPHPVTVLTFEMLETSVTESQYEAVMDDDPSCNYNGAYGANYPVECIDWDHAKAFCLAVGGRLCAEAEWEYAARAGTTTKYYCGDEEACLEDIAWTGINSGEKKHAVKLKNPNAFGLYDMLGNVMDWVEDCWHGTYGGAPDVGYPPWQDNCSSDYRVLRGGSWLHPDPHLLRASSRYPYPTDYFFNFLGARCCRSVLQ